VWAPWWTMTKNERLSLALLSLPGHLTAAAAAPSLRPPNAVFPCSTRLSGLLPLICLFLPRRVLRFLFGDGAGVRRSHGQASQFSAYSLADAQMGACSVGELPASLTRRREGSNGREWERNGQRSRKGVEGSKQGARASEQRRREGAGRSGAERNAAEGGLSRGYKRAERSRFMAELREVCQSAPDCALVCSSVL
jgi:hypothetical protein